MEEQEKLLIMNANWERIEDTTGSWLPTEPKEPDDPFYRPDEMEFAPQRADWYEFTDLTYDNEGLQNIKIWRRGDEYLIEINTWNSWESVLCQNLGEALRIVREVKTLLVNPDLRGDTSDNDRLKFYADVVEKIDRIGNGVWELSNDFDAAFWNFFGTLNTRGAVDKLQDVLEAIDGSVSDVARAVDGIEIPE